MDDVKPEVSQAEQAPVEQTTEQPSQVAEQTSEAPVVAERTVPYGRFSEVNKRLRETERKLAEQAGKEKLSAFDPNDLEAIMAHPFVQELQIKQAKQELTDYARIELEKYPNIHASVKKAILANVRGFVNENTRDVETAKLDLLDYIESIMEEQAPTTPKTFPIAATNSSKSNVQGTRPTEIQEILDIPMLEWTTDQEKVVAEYAKSHK